MAPAPYRHGVTPPMFALGPSPEAEGLSLIEEARGVKQRAEKWHALFG